MIHYTLKNIFLEIVGLIIVVRDIYGGASFLGCSTTFLY
jgi:hypothetical protein